MFEITKYGSQAVAPPGSNSGMPAYQNSLTDEEIVAALAYIKRTWPAAIQAQQRQAQQDQ